MAKTLNTVVKASIEGTYKNLLDLSTPVDSLAKLSRIELANGTGAASADLLWHDQRTLAASGSESLDLAGSLVDSYGATLTFVEVRAILVSAAAANANNVQVTRPASNGWPGFLAAGDGLIVPPGGVFLLASPTDAAWPVTASTGDLLGIANSAGGTSVTYDIVIVGTSA